MCITVAFLLACIVYALLVRPQKRRTVQVSEELEFDTCELIDAIEKDLAQ